MTSLELGLTLVMIATATAGIAYVGHVIRISGRDRADDATRVQHVMATAPYERLDNVLTKR